MSAHRYAVDPSLRALLADMQLSPAKVLRRAGLRADLLARGPVWLSEDQFFALWRAIEVESGDPNLPLRIEDSFSPELFAAPIFAALLSADLNTAATRLAQYKALIGPMRLEVEVGPETTTIGYRWPVGARPPSTLVLAELLFWVAMARTGTRQRIEPLRVTAPEPPEDVEAYRTFLGVPIERSERQAVTFAAADAALPFLTENEAMWETFEPELRRRLGELELEAAMDERVRAVLLELLPVGRTGMAEVAAELAMSTRTLQRRLRDEGTSFQRVLDATREDLALHYLSTEHLSAPEIAFLLGYGEPSSFYRAFHNWTGETPERVRAGVA